MTGKTFQGCISRGLQQSDTPYAIKGFSGQWQSYFVKWPIFISQNYLHKVVLMELGSTHPALKVLVAVRPSTSSMIAIIPSRHWSLCVSSPSSCGWVFWKALCLQSSWKYIQQPRLFNTWENLPSSMALQLISHISHDCQNNFHMISMTCTFENSQKSFPSKSNGKKPSWSMKIRSL